jgi:hypothetical protein
MTQTCTDRLDENFARTWFVNGEIFDNQFAWLFAKNRSLHECPFREHARCTR